MPLLILIIFNIVLGDESCTPFAPRVQLGTYYTDFNDANNMINILFNTKSSCPKASLMISGKEIAVTHTSEIDMG